MGYSSQTGQFGIGIQSVKGTAVAATRFARLRGGGLQPIRSLMVPDAEIGGNRDTPQANLGPMAFGGDIEFYARMQMLNLLMYGAFGSVVDTTPAEGEQHVITGADTLPWLTVEERISNEFESMQYVDVRVNSLRLEAEAEGYFMGSANLFGLGGESGFTDQGAPTTDLSPLMVGTQVNVTYDGNPLPANSMNFEINNNLEQDDFVLGSIYAQDATAKRREITAGVTYRPSDAVLWKAAMFGDESIDEAQDGPAYDKALVITAESFEFAEGTTPFSIQISMPNAALAPHEASPNGDDVLSTDLEFTALRPSNGTPACTVTIINDVATTS